jgi:hypothetical protein
MVPAVTERRVYGGLDVRNSGRVIYRSGLGGKVVVTMLVRQSVVAQLGRQDMELAQAPHTEINAR